MNSKFGLAVIGLLGLAAACVPASPYKFDNEIGPASGKFTAEQVESSAATLPAGAIKLSVPDAILMGIRNNRSLRVDRLSPLIQQTNEQAALGVFDPVLGIDLPYVRSRNKVAGGGSTITNSFDPQVTISKFLATGTTVAGDVSTGYTWGSAVTDGYVTNTGLSVTQSLLRGFGLDVNLAALREAQLGTLSSQYELRGFAEALVADIEDAYWDYALAKRQIDIYEDSLKVAQQQLEETRQRIQVGKLAQTELAASEAQAALAEEDLINGRSTMEKARLTLLRLLNPNTPDLWSRDVIVQAPPEIPNVKLEPVDTHVAIAMLRRPDLNQAVILIRQNQLEVVRTRNGLLPRMDLFVSLGRTGYAGSFGGSYANLREGFYDLSAGAQFEYAIGNNAAKAANKRAVLTERQGWESLANLRQLAQQDVRTAYIEVNRTAEQIRATAATRKAQEETYRAEVEKFRVGKSTSLLVSQAQRDLLSAQISEVQARVNYLKALVGLYQLEGSLLDRRGIQAPGSEPAESILTKARQGIGAQPADVRKP